MTHQGVFLQQLSHELAGRGRVPSRLDKDIEHFPFDINRAPKMHLLSVDPDEHLVEMPADMRLGPARPQPAGDVGAKHVDPAPDGFVGDLEASLRGDTRRRAS